MLIDDENIRVQYDSTAESPIMAGDPLPLPFKFVEKTQVRAILSDGTELIINQDYTVGYPEEDEPDEDESMVMTDNMVVILNIDIPIGDTITIYRETALDQTSEFPQEARFSSRKIEDALDKLTMQNQEQRESLARALKLPLNAPIDIGNLALPNPEPNRSVKWNSQGTALINTEFDPDTALVTTENYKNQALTAASGAAKSEAEATKQATDAKNSAKAAEEDSQAILDKSDALLNMSRILPMFTPIWADHLLNDASFLRADTFSWHSGNTYEAAYKTLLAEFTSPDCVHKSENGVTYRRTPSGFKIADPNKHDDVLNAFTSTGKSWFYIIDPDNKRFKLPRTKYSFTGVRDTVGGDVQAGLPTLTTNSLGAHTHTRGTMNITGSLSPAWEANIGRPASGAFTASTSGGASEVPNNPASGGATWNFDASKSWTGATSSNGDHSHTIPGTADTVQPPATQMYLYFFVGNFNRPSADVNIGELVEYVNELDFVGETEKAKQEITATKVDGLAELNTTKTNSVTEINNLTKKCLTDINNTGLDGKVSKLGDTMTGNLKIQGGSTQHVVQCISNLLMSENPTAATGVGKFQVLDKEGNYLMQAGCERSTDGRNQAFIRAHSPEDWSKSVTLSVTYFRDGTYGCNFPKCTTKATTTSSARSDLVAVVVKNYINGASWYRVWSDGWKEQGGYVANTSGTITLLQSMSNNTYTCICLHNGTSAKGEGTVHAYNKTTTQFNYGLSLSTSGMSGMSWYVCGY